MLHILGRTFLLAAGQYEASERVRDRSVRDRWLLDERRERLEAEVRRFWI